MSHALLRRTAYNLLWVGMASFAALTAYFGFLQHKAEGEARTYEALCRENKLALSRLQKAPAGSVNPSQLDQAQWFAGRYYDAVHDMDTRVRAGKEPANATTASLLSDYGDWAGSAYMYNQLLAGAKSDDRRRLYLNNVAAALLLHAATTSSLKEKGAALSQASKFLAKCTACKGKEPSALALNKDLLKAEQSDISATGESSRE